LLVVACIDVRRAGNNEPTTEKIFETSKLCVAMAVENLLLAAHFLGLGGCPVASFRPLAVQRVLHLPNDIKPLLLVPIGHPMVPPEPSVRRDISEVVRYETWEAA
jgi:nitroreductase